MLRAGCHFLQLRSPQASRRSFHLSQVLSMPAQKIDGNAIAKRIREQISEKIQNTQSKNPRFQPSLAIIQIGERQDSTSYVTMKQKAAADANIDFQHIKLPEDISEAAVSRSALFRPLY